MIILNTYEPKYEIYRHYVTNSLQDTADIILGLNYDNKKAQTEQILAQRWLGNLVPNRFQKYKRELYTVYFVYEHFKSYDGRPYNDRFSMPINDILNNLCYSLALNKEVNFIIFSDGTWKIHLRRNQYNRLQFWVEYDYMSGQYNSSQVQIMQTTRCTADFQIKPSVREKILRTYAEIVKTNLFDF